MRLLNFASISPHFRGRSDGSPDPRWASRLIENFAQEGGPLTTTKEDFLYKSFIEEFYRAEKLKIHGNEDVSRKTNSNSGYYAGSCFLK